MDKAIIGYRWWITKEKSIHAYVDFKAIRGLLYPTGNKVYSALREPWSNEEEIPARCIHHEVCNSNDPVFPNAKKPPLTKSSEFWQRITSLKCQKGYHSFYKEAIDLLENEISALGKLDNRKEPQNFHCGITLNWGDISFRENGFLSEFAKPLAIIENPYDKKLSRKIANNYKIILVKSQKDLITVAEEFGGICSKKDIVSEEAPYR